MRSGSTNSKQVSGRRAARHTSIEQQRWRFYFLMDKPSEVFPNEIEIIFNPTSSRAHRSLSIFRCVDVWTVLLYIHSLPYISVSLYDCKKNNYSQTFCYY